jgi:hypothetical protein
MEVSSTSAIFTSTENFGIRVEYNEDFVIVHFARLDKLTKSTLLDLKIYLEDFHRFVRTAGYTGVHAAVDPDNKLVNKLIDKLNFKYQGLAEGLRVYVYEERGEN